MLPVVNQDLLDLDLKFFQHNYNGINEILHDSLYNCDPNFMFKYLFENIIFNNKYSFDIIYSISKTNTCKMRISEIPESWKVFTIRDATIRLTKFLIRLLDEFISKHNPRHDYISEWLINQYKDYSAKIISNDESSLEPIITYVTGVIPLTPPKQRATKRPFVMKYFYSWDDVLNALSPYKNKLIDNMLKVNTYKGKNRDDMYDYFIFLVKYSCDDIHESDDIYTLMSSEEPSVRAENIVKLFCNND